MLILISRDKTRRYLLPLVHAWKIELIPLVYTPRNHNEVALPSNLAISYAAAEELLRLILSITRLIGATGIICNAVFNDGTYLAT